MTVSSTTARQTYLGDGSTATYSYNFRIFTDADLVLVKRNTTTGAETLLALTTDYTVTGAGAAAGGTFTLLAGVLPSGYSLAAYREVDLLQATDLRNQGAFLAEVLERALDRATMMAQQLQDQLNRALRYPDSEAGGAAAKLPAKELRALQQLAFDADGNPIAGGTASATVSVAMQPVVAAADLAAARLAMGGLVPTVATIAALKALTGADLNGYVMVAGYYTAGDGAGGLFRWVAADVTADNGGTVIAPTAGGGRFHRVWTGPLNVKWFGAKGDAATNDTAAFTAALAALSTRGGRLYVPAGEYRTTAQLTLPAFVQMFGDRTTVTTKGSVIHCHDSNVNLLHIPDGDWAVEDLVLWHNAGVSAGTGHCLNLGVAGGAFSSGGYARNVRFYEAPQAAVNLANAGDSVIVDCGFESNNYGILGQNVGGVASDIRVRGGVFYANYIDIWCAYANRWMLTGVLFQLQGSPSFAATSGQLFDGTSTSVIIDGCQFDRCGGPIRLSGGALNVIQGCKFTEQRRGCVVVAGASSYNVVQGNACLDGSKETANTYDAIIIDGTAGFNVIANNSIVVGFRYGVNIANAACPQNSVKGNTATTCATASYANASASTRFMANDWGDGKANVGAAGLYPPDQTAAIQGSAGIYGGSGAPSNANGANGDIFIRADGAGGTTIYHKRAGAWVGVV